MIDPPETAARRSAPRSPCGSPPGRIALALFAIIFFRLWYLQVLSGDQYLAEATTTRSARSASRLRAATSSTATARRSSRTAGRRRRDRPDCPSERDAATWGQRMSQRSLRPTGRASRRRSPTSRRELRVAARLPRARGTTATEIQRRIQSLAQVPYATFRVETDVPRSVMNYVQERQTLFPGVTVEQVYLRQYPRTTLAAQMLGTVGEIQLKQLGGKHFRGVKQGTVVGQGGLEYQYDRYLRGTDGSREIQVDALGNPKGELREVTPKAGQRLKLSLDLALQREGQEALPAEGNPGGQPAPSWR